MTGCSFSENPVDVIGTRLKDQVEERLKFYETGEAPKKNVDVMREAVEEVSVRVVRFFTSGHIRQLRVRLACLHLC